MSKRLPTGRDMSCCDDTDIQKESVELASDDSYVNVIYTCQNCGEEREVIYEPTAVRSPEEVFQ